MTKRSIAAILWFFAGWSIGAVTAFAFSAPTVLAPVVAVLACGLVAADPRGRIWDTRAIAD